RNCWMSISSSAMVMANVSSTRCAALALPRSRTESMQIIKGEQIVEDQWRTVESDDVSAVGEGDVIVSFALWKAERETLMGRNGGLGIKLEPDDPVEEIVDDLDRFQVIALDFPRYTDGRAYSTARLLRDRYGYDRELRA